MGGVEDKSSQNEPEIREDKYWDEKNRVWKVRKLNKIQLN